MNCAVADCDEPVSARGWCRKHYHRWRQHGNVETVNPPGRKPNSAPHTSNGRVQVTCWCEATVLWVDISVLRDGVTGSCGAPDCREAVA